MASLRQSDSYTTYNGGTALWYNTFHTALTKETALIVEPSTNMLDRTPKTTAPVVFLDLKPSVRTSLPPQHPLWDEVEVILAKTHHDMQFPSIEEEDAWLDEMRKGWSSNLETLDNESY